MEPKLELYINIFELYIIRIVLKVIWNGTQTYLEWYPNLFIMEPKLIYNGTQTYL